jgi:hypothetical protein
LLVRIADKGDRVASVFGSVKRTFLLDAAGGRVVPDTDITYVHDREIYQRTQPHPTKGFKLTREDI